MQLHAGLPPEHKEPPPFSIAPYFGLAPASEQLEIEFDIVVVTLTLPMSPFVRHTTYFREGLQLMGL